MYGFLNEANNLYAFRAGFSAKAKAYFQQAFAFAHDSRALGPFPGGGAGFFQDPDFLPIPVEAHIFAPAAPGFCCHRGGLVFHRPFFVYPRANHFFWTDFPVRLQKEFQVSTG
jgi:hypothetical protein